MEGIEYEVLIRSIYQCPRGSKHGADARIYRKMSSCFWALEDQDIGISLQERLSNYMQAFILVRSFLRSAIRKFNKQMPATTDIAGKVLLLHYVNLLDDGFFNKQLFDHIVDKVTEIHHKHLSTVVNATTEV